MAKDCSVNCTFNLHGTGTSDASTQGRTVTNMGAPKLSKGKVVKTSSPTFAKGGSTKMFGKQAAGPQTPGQSAQKDSSDGGRIAKGGKTKMFGKQSVMTAPAGKVIK